MVRSCTQGRLSLANPCILQFGNIAAANPMVGFVCQPRIFNNLVVSLPRIEMAILCRLLLSLCRLSHFLLNPPRSFSISDKPDGACNSLGACPLVVPSDEVHWLRRYWERLLELLLERDLERLLSREYGVVAPRLVSTVEGELES
jgi:hypothetical protein